MKSQAQIYEEWVLNNMTPEEIKEEADRLRAQKDGRFHVVTLDPNWENKS